MPPRNSAAYFSLPAQGGFGPVNSPYVLLGKKTITKLPAVVKGLGHSKPVIIVDEHVAALYAKKVLDLFKRNGEPPDLIQIPQGEQSKTLHTAELLYQNLIKLKATRHTPVIALGGGVTTDLAGFAASTYMRGLPLILVPTTLLAQADAAIGGKTGVNLSKGKNLIGTFYPAYCTIIDYGFLKTLPEREFRSGFAEVIKMCILKGEKSFSTLEKFATRFQKEGPLFESLLSQAILGKLAVVRKDPQERRGERAQLNLGHTFAHALEAATAYKAYTHGEAVAIGLVGACMLAESLVGFSKEATNRIKRVLLSFGLPVSYRKSTPSGLFAFMQHDKKKQETLRFVLPVRLGKVIVQGDVPESLVFSVLTRLMGSE